jgi:hypothetical protein
MTKHRIGTHEEWQAALEKLRSYKQRMGSRSSRECGRWTSASSPGTRRALQRTLRP